MQRILGVVASLGSFVSGLLLTLAVALVAWSAGDISTVLCMSFFLIPGAALVAIGVAGLRQSTAVD